MPVVITTHDDWVDVVRLAVANYFPGEDIAVGVGDPSIVGPLDSFALRHDLAVFLRMLRRDWLKTHPVIEPDWKGP